MQENLTQREILQSENVRPGRLAETPAQTAGPFYPSPVQFIHNNDLTLQAESRGTPLGQVVYVRGIVRDEFAAPLAGVRVEIWQACASGRYNHATDPNPAPLDPNFRYWGDTETDGAGAYVFKTIVPGVYPAEVGWDRPPHIHFKCVKSGYKDVVTQMYWRGHPLNDLDQILLNVPEHLRGDVIVDFLTNPEDPSTQIGTFNITLLKAR